MDSFLAERAGNDLHRTGTVVTPGPDPDFAHAAAPGGKQRRVPRKEPFGGEWLVIVAGGVEHHFDDAIDVAVCGLDCANVYA